MTALSTPGFRAPPSSFLFGTRPVRATANSQRPESRVATHGNPAILDALSNLSSSRTLASRAPDLVIHAIASLHRRSISSKRRHPREVVRGLPRAFRFPGSSLIDSRSAKSAFRTLVAQSLLRNALETVRRLVHRPTSRLGSTSVASRLPRISANSASCSVLRRKECFRLSRSTPSWLRSPDGEIGPQTLRFRSVVRQSHALSVQRARGFPLLAVELSSWLLPKPGRIAPRSLDHPSVARCRK